MDLLAGASRKSLSLPASKAQWLVILTGVLGMGIVLWWGSVRPPQAAFDDAYITYRYADNLRRGLGLVYNEGQWVLGTTTPLFAMLLGLVGLLVPDLELAGHWLGVAAWMVAVWSGAGLLWQAGRHRAAAAGALFLALQPTMASSLGMETPLLVALMLLTAWAWLGQRRRLVPFLAAALLLTRPDSALWLLVLGLEVWRRRRLPWQEAVATLVLLSPWLLYTTLRYGSPLPNSVGAKIGQSNLMPVSGLQPFIQALPANIASALPLPLALLYGATLAGGLFLVLTRLRSWWWLPAWILSYSLIYTWLDVVSFPWYFVPALTAVALLAALAIGALLGDNGRDKAGAGPSAPRSQNKRWLALAAPALGLTLLLILAGGWAVTTANTARSTWGTRASYRTAGEWLAANTDRDASVATIEIGAIGYFSRRPIVDTMGLVTPDMTRHQVGWVETLVYALNAHQPAYVVTLPNTAWDQITERWWFARNYEATAQFDEVTLYRRLAPPQRYHVNTDVPFTGGLRLTGITVGERTLRPGETVELWVDVTVSEPQSSSLLLTAYLQHAQTFEQSAVTRSLAFDGLYDSTRWQPGDELRVPLRLDVPHGLSTGAYRLGLLFYDPQYDGGRPLLEAPDTPSQGVLLGWLRAGQPPVPASSGLQEQVVSAHWENGIELESIGVPPQPIAPGAALDLQLNWRAHGPVARDLTVFVHVVDDEGNIVAQLDQRPFAGRWPTAAWLPGDVFQDTMSIALPPSLAAADYGIRIGLYDGAGRLPLQSGDEFILLPDAVVVQSQ